MMPWSKLSLFIPALILSCLVIISPPTSAQPIPAAIAVNTFAYAQGSSDNGRLKREFSLEPVFLSMSEVSQHGFGILEMDMLARTALHWAYDPFYSGSDKLGLDHAYITINKGIFLLNEGQGGAFDFGLGLDLDWRRIVIAPREGEPPMGMRSVLGAGIAARAKFAWASHMLFAPAAAYDLYTLPEMRIPSFAGHGLRISGDLWLSPWVGRMALTLQPFWHWRRIDLSEKSSPSPSAVTSTFGFKFGLGSIPESSP